MPIYEFQCASCHKVHEVMQKFSDEPLKTCPDCEGPVTKLISTTSFALKGTGWYVTDYKKSGKSSVAGSLGSEAKPVTADAPGAAASSSVPASPAPSSAPSSTSAPSNASSSSPASATKKSDS